MKLSLIFLLLIVPLQWVIGQIDAKLMSHIDLSATQITFVYGGDLWIMPKDGGQAVQLTDSPGQESYPKFSPDGKEIAFSASYNGNMDIYVMPARGGLPQRVTYASFNDRVVDWHPDGQRILFASGREGTTPRVNHFFTIDRKGGFAEKSVIPYGELGSYSPDGKKLAYITKITENYPFKRYRGGLTSDIIIFDLDRKEAKNITENTAIDGRPLWLDDTIYFISDRDSLLRRNIWKYDTATADLQQLTFSTDFDITFFSGDSGTLVYEAGGTLHLLEVDSGTSRPLDVRVVSDLSAEIPRRKAVGDQISSMAPSPGGKRVVFEARGELFNAPVKEGFVVNLTQSSGAFDQSPSWSPDGKTIAWWSDSSGEYELYVRNPDGSDAPRKLTSRGKGFGYRLFWSPDSKKIAFIDEANKVYVIEVASGKSTVADTMQWHLFHPGRYEFHIGWSPDSEWIVYDKTLDTSNQAIFAYHLPTGSLKQVTSGYYSDYRPVFGREGTHLFFLTDREYQAAYSGLNDGTWIYPNNSRIAAISLTKEAAYLLAPKNDSLPGADDADTAAGDKEKGKEEEKAIPKLQIDWEGLESRLTVLPPRAGNIRELQAFDGKLIYERAPITGDTEGKSILMYYDLESREEKEIIGKLEAVSPTPDKKLLLVRSDGKYGVVKPLEDQKIEEPIPTGDLVMQWNPKEEWRQIFQDTWRRYRDFFYDVNMQGVDWAAMRERYGKLVEDARTRWDITNIQSNMQAELSAGHTYTGGGDTEEVESVETGYLGIDWEKHNGAYRIAKIVRPASWENEARSPLDRPGVLAAAGDYILSVNGRELDPSREPYAAFEGLAGKTVTLGLGRKGQKDKETAVVIQCLTQDQEAELRYLAWIEKNRQLVAELSDGKLGYIYMANTGAQGQRELVKMFYGQLDKQGFIIDERFNGGGQLSDRFMEVLKRPVIYNLYLRYGRPIQVPGKANTGPMGMLINGWAGSGGDAFPWAFRELNGGPIVGERTLGILVGPATGHRLIDGGSITVPGARLYHNNGKWFDEGVGIQPDIAVWDDPGLISRGRDPQMERVVTEVMKALKTNPGGTTPPPPLENRTARGLQSGN